MRPLHTTSSDTRTLGEPRSDEQLVVDVVVISGPDCSTSMSLAAGRYVLGRSAAALLRIEDARLGLHHAIVEISTDPNPANGNGAVTAVVTVTQMSGQAPIRVWGEPLTGSQALELPARLSIGMSDVDITRHDPARRDGVQPDDVRPSPDAERTERAGPPARIPVPDPQCDHGTAQATGLIGAAAAIPVVLVAAFLDYPLAALAMAVGAVVSTVAWFVGAMLTWRSNRRSDRVGDAKRTHFIERLSAERAAERLRHLDDHARLDQVITAAERVASSPAAQGEFWSRRLRCDPASGRRVFRPIVGVGARRWSPMIEGQIGPDIATDIDRASTIADVPIPVELARGEMTAVVGDRSETEPLLRSMVAQLAVLHAPDDWQLVIVSVDRARWEWAVAFPHIRSVIGSSLIIDPTEPDLLATSMVIADCPLSRSTLLVVDDPSRLVRAHEALGGFMERVEPATLIIVERGAPVPGACDAAIGVGSTGAISISRQDGFDMADSASAVSMCGLSTRQAKRVARALASFADSGRPGVLHPLDESPSSHRGPLPNWTASSSAL